MRPLISTCRVTSFLVTHFLVLFGGATSNAIYCSARSYVSKRNAQRLEPSCVLLCFTRASLFIQHFPYFSWDYPISFKLQQSSLLHTAINSNCTCNLVTVFTILITTAYFPNTICPQSNLSRHGLNLRFSLQVSYLGLSRWWSAAIIIFSAFFFYFSSI